MFLGVNIDMTEQDLIIQDLRRENAELKERLNKALEERNDFKSRLNEIILALCNGREVR